MKIAVKKTVPTSFSLDPKHKPEYKTIEREVEIRDELLYEVGTFLVAQYI
ncbi:MAG TPA: hypothetical protein VMU27_02865 [Candidatus Paceibacterota bacterium]|nr:hypothetical protein [Candidatus Paceibacterota bacterium]